MSCGPLGRSIWWELWHSRWCITGQQSRPSSVFSANTVYALQARFVCSREMVASSMFFYKVHRLLHRCSVCRMQSLTKCLTASTFVWCYEGISTGMAILTQELVNSSLHIKHGHRGHMRDLHAHLSFIVEIHMAYHRPGFYV